MKIRFYHEGEKMWAEDIIEALIEDGILVCTVTSGSTINIDLENIITIRDDGY